MIFFWKMGFLLVPKMHRYIYTLHKCVTSFSAPMTFGTVYISLAMPGGMTNNNHHATPAGNRPR